MQIRIGRWSHPRVGALLLLATGMFALQGCGCNLVGCVDGLRVHLASMPVGSFQVELLVAGVVQSAPVEATCTGAVACYQDIQFRNFDTDHVSVRVTTSGGTRLTEFAKVNFSKSYPNGRGCTPTCRNATVTALIP